MLIGHIPSAGLGRTSTGESGMLDDCLKSIPYDPLDLILLDRNFGHYYSVSKLLADRRPFCIRMSVSCSGFAERSMADPRQDFIICWEPSKSEWETSPGASPITDRVTKTVLKSGVEELLVSSMTDMVAVNLAHVPQNSLVVATNLVF